MKRLWNVDELHRNVDELYRDVDESCRNVDESYRNVDEYDENESNYYDHERNAFVVKKYMCKDWHFWHIKRKCSCLFINNLLLTFIVGRLAAHTIHKLFDLENDVDEQ